MRLRNRADEFSGGTDGSVGAMGVGTTVAAGAAASPIQFPWQSQASPDWPQPRQP
ncbi:MAG: hypothetical protein VB835_01840 [Pirellulales bacterium]